MYTHTICTQNHFKFTQHSTVYTITYNGSLATVAREFSCIVHMADTSRYSEECLVASVWVHERQCMGKTMKQMLWRMSQRTWRCIYLSVQYRGANTDHWTCIQKVRDSSMIDDDCTMLGVWW